MAKVVYLKNFRKGLATNSSSTHSIIYKNKDEMFKDLDVFELDYYDRCDSTIAASKEAKIKYVLACVYHNEALVELLSVKYPQMKEYFPLIKKQMELDDKDRWDEPVFGMYTRGSFSNNDIEFSYRFCCDVIDDPEKIIVGGSDEMDFVYDTIEGHKEISTPDDLDFSKRDRVTKNGNYYYGFGWGKNPGENSEKGKLRFSFNNEKPVPEYPELIDLKITGKCNHGCPMCFEGSTMKGKHADIKYLTSLVNHTSRSGRNVVEYSIGGGNVLLYPHLEELFKAIRETNGYVNVTIKADDTETLLKKKSLFNLFKEYVDGCGISVFNEDDARKLQNFQHELRKGREYGDHHTHIVAHIIPEYIGLDMSLKIKNILKWVQNGDYDDYAPILYLGYKTLERGESQEWHKFTDNELEKLFGDEFENIDTLFGQRYKEWLVRNYEMEFSYTPNEGEYSMYVDAVNKKAYMSSYNLEKPYDLDSYWRDITKVFGSIREDNGFVPYSKTGKHYWD